MPHVTIEYLKCDQSELSGAVSVKYILDCVAVLWKVECKIIPLTFYIDYMLILIVILINWVKQLIKINFTWFFKNFFNVTTRKFNFTDVSHIIFLCIDLGNRKNCYLLKMYYMRHAIPSALCALSDLISQIPWRAVFVASIYRQGNLGKRSK